MRANIFRFHMEDGSSVEGYVQGSGGEINMRNDVASTRMKTQMMLARRGSSLHIYEPKTGHVRCRIAEQEFDVDLTKVASFEIVN